jgi:uncharacterized protein YdgA (DUF945 family)
MAKKAILVPIVLVISAGAYVAASWGLGRSTHARIDAWTHKLEERGAGIIKVAERRSYNGIFSSREDVTIEIDTSVLDKLGGATPGAQNVDEQDQDLDDEQAPQLDKVSWHKVADQESPHSIRFTVRNDIQHGPLPGFTSIGLAKIESRFVLDEETRKAFAKVIGDQDPILVISTLGIAGSSLVEVTSPAFKHVDGDTTVDWQGFGAKFALGRNVNTLKCDGAAPGLSVTRPDHSNVKLGRIVFNCDIARAFDDLYVGRTSLELQGMEAALPNQPSVSVGSVSYSGDANAAGDFVDVRVKLLMNSLRAAEFNMNDLEYSLSLKHLHGPTYAAFSRKLQDLTTSSALGDPTAAIAMMGAFAEYGPQILEHDPQLVIERIGFSMPEGEAGVKATLRLKDFTKADLAQGTTAALLKKLDATADVWVSDGLLKKDWAAAETENTDANAGEGSSAEDRIRAIQTQVTALEEQGFVKRNHDRLESHIEYKDGMLSTNGRPIGGPGASN